jgi:hypothetical protein
METCQQFSRLCKESTKIEIIFNDMKIISDETDCSCGNRLKVQRAEPGAGASK